MRTFKYYAKVFFWICFPIILFGLFAGTLNMMNPKAVYIPNGELGSGFEGIDGVIAGVLSASVVGVVFGLLGMLIALIFGYGTQKLIDAKIESATSQNTSKFQDNIGDDS